MKFTNDIQKNPVRKIKIMNCKDGSHYIHLGCYLNQACVSGS